MKTIIMTNTFGKPIEVTFEQFHQRWEGASVEKVRSLAVFASDGDYDPALCAELQDLGARLEVLKGIVLQKEWARNAKE